MTLFGEMIQFDEHIFQMGWFNHQLVIDVSIIIAQVKDFQMVAGEGVTGSLLLDDRRGLGKVWF